MQWTGVKSSVIAAVSYDNEVNALFVLFRSGRIYVYHDVSEYKYRKLINAESVGKYFNESIRGKHEENNTRESAHH